MLDGSGARICPLTRDAIARWLITNLVSSWPTPMTIPPA